jgi:hypothetical protein
MINQDVSFNFHLFKIKICDSNIIDNELNR